MSPFNYAENRPISGIDLHGLQYVDAKKALFNIQSGQTWLSTRGMNKTFGGLYQHDGGIDGYGQRYIGRTMPIDKIRLTGAGKDFPLYSGLGATHAKWIGGQIGNVYENSPIAKSTNKPDRRYNISKAYNETSTNMGGIGRVGLGLIAIDIAASLKTSVEGFIHSMESKEQLGYIEQSWNDVINAVNEGLVDSKFLNMGDLSTITNSVFQGGEIENSELSEIAGSIIEKNKIVIYKAKSGLDNVHHKPVRINDE